MILKSIIVWAIISFAVMLSGVAVGTILEPYMSDFRARQVGIFIGCVITFAITYELIEWTGARREFELLAIGFIWMGLALACEIMLRRFILGFPWELVASDYDLAIGGFLSIDLVSLMLSPLIAGKLRKGV